MAELLLNEIDEIHARTFGRGARSIGVTGANQSSDVSSVAKSLAARSAQSGARSLLIDLSPRDDIAAEEIGKGTFVPKKPAIETTSGDEGYDIVRTNQLASGPSSAIEVQDLRHILQEGLSRYNQIIVDLDHVAAPTQPKTAAINGAAACDAVVLVCRTFSVTKTEVESAIETLTGSNAKIAGLFVNNRNAPTMTDEILREMYKMGDFLPKGVQDFIARKIIQNQNV